jgi:predicted nuclease of predicted toxin-antitoxin system
LIYNLSPQLVNRFADLYPQSQHVFRLGMDQDDDRQIWDYAAQNNFTIVTRDSDYNDLSLLLGYPPKIIWIRRGNCTTPEIETILRCATAVIQQFSQTGSVAVLTLY